MLKSAIQHMVNVTGTASIGYGGALAVQQSQANGFMALLSAMPTTLEEWTAIIAILSAIGMAISKFITAITEIREKKLERDIKKQEHNLAVREKELELEKMRLEIESAKLNKASETE